MIILMIIVVLVLFGLCFGSFVNALVWRIHQQSKNKKTLNKAEFSIVKGRSMCIHCRHELAWYDLLPVLSWIQLRGKCRYCKEAISWQYPLVEIVTAILFVVSYIFWPEGLTGTQWVIFSLWLVALTGLIALVVYDLRWMLLPNRIIFPLYGIAILYVISKAVATPSSAFHLLSSALLGVLVGGGIFYILFQLSEGRWIGGGDVKLGFLLGGLVASPSKAMLMLFAASLLGTAISVPLLLSGKAKRSTRIPFGPFLVAGCIIAMLFGQSLIDRYLETIGYNS